MGGGIPNIIHAVTGPTPNPVILSGAALAAESKDPADVRTSTTAKDLSAAYPAQAPLGWGRATTVLPAITAALIQPLFPFTSLANIAANLPHLLAALAAAGLTDLPMLLAALATIRAEAEPFLPLTEAESRFNTSPGGRPGAVSGHPFDLYDHRADLGNLGPPDGANFRGRGYVQLTGRANYGHYGARLSLDLVVTPTLAASPEPAATILAAFLADRQTAIRSALARNDLARARRLVNGGSNGLDRFTAAYSAGLKLFA
jgi:putative chitinase